MNRSPTRTRLALALALSAASGVPVASAQEGSEASGLEEITVTARRREESLQEVPIAITAYSAEALELRGMRDISELAQSTPSVTIEPSRATNSTLTAFIRGVGQQDPLAGFEQGVALYIDDVYIARPQGSLLDIYDVERIEILRGPQGTLYGRNAVGGAIKYVTRRLPEDTEARVRASYGSYDQLDLVGSASTALTSMFRVGAAVASLDRDGYGENKTTGEDQYEKDVLAYRVSAEFLPNEDLLLRLAYDKTQDDSNPVAGFRPYPGARSGAPVLGDLRDTTAGAADAISTAGIDGNNEVETEGFHASLEWSPSDCLTLRSISAWRDDYTESVIDFDSLAVIDFDAPVIYDNEQFSEEFQLLWDDERWHAVLGLYYLDATASNDFDVVLGQLSPLGVTAYTGGTVDTEAWSVFADLTYDLNERLAVSIGGRYTEDTREADILRAQYLGFGSPFFGNTAAIFLRTQSDYEADKTFDDFSPRVNLSYRLNEAAQVYAGYSQGFKAGSFDPRGANLATPEVTEGFEPETLDSWEAGIKADWFDSRARTNLALFYSEYQDMQIPGSIGIDTNGDGVNDSFVGAVTNAGEAEIQGLEFEGEFLLTDELRATAALSLLDAEIKEWIVGGVNVADQREMQNTPDTMANLALDYSTALVGGTLNLHAEWAYKSKVVQFEIPSPDLDQDSYDLFNASIVWLAPEGNWSIGVHGKNLGDEDVKTAGYCFGFVSTGCASSLGLENNTTVFYAPPRTWTATVDYRF
jgi:iron complex outermembrane receptor protein